MQRCRVKSYAVDNAPDNRIALFLFVFKHHVSVFDVHGVGAAFVVIVVVDDFSVHGGLAVFNVNIAHDFVDKLCDAAFYYDVRAVFVMHVNTVFVDMHSVSVFFIIER